MCAACLFFFVRTRGWRSQYWISFETYSRCFSSATSKLCQQRHHRQGTVFRLLKAIMLDQIDQKWRFEALESRRIWINFYPGGEIGFFSHLTIACIPRDIGFVCPFSYILVCFRSRLAFFLPITPWQVTPCLPKAALFLVLIQRII